MPITSGGTGLKRSKDRWSVGIRGSTPRRAENHTLADELTQKSCALLCPIRIRESLTTMDITNLGWEPNTQHAELGPDAEAESAVASLRIALAWLRQVNGCRFEEGSGRRSFTDSPRDHGSSLRKRKLTGKRNITIATNRPSPLPEVPQMNLSLGD
jgi:hypothetical protein